MVRPPPALAFVSALALAAGAFAQTDRNLGRNLAAACANCHGTNGVSQPGMPGLAGQPQAYLEQQMRDFKAGRRPATVMHQIARGYSEEQIRAIAAYLSEQAR